MHLKGDTTRKYLLWDTSALLGYYVPEAATRAANGSPARAHECSKTIIDSSRHHRCDVQLYVPNIVIAEVFSNLDQLCFSHWDTRVNRTFGGAGKTMHATRYRTVRNKFRKDIRNGALFYQYELNRYHILALDLIAPIDKYKKHYRERKNMKGEKIKKQIRPMGPTDLLICAMALHLARLHGTENVALVSCDRRMKAIFSGAPKTLKKTTVGKLGLDARAKDLGFGEWSPTLYPRTLDPLRSTSKELELFFGAWPLDTKKISRKEPKA